MNENQSAKSSLFPVHGSDSDGDVTHSAADRWLRNFLVYFWQHCIQSSHFPTAIFRRVKDLFWVPVYST